MTRRYQPNCIDKFCSLKTSKRGSYCFKCDYKQARKVLRYFRSRQFSDYIRRKAYGAIFNR